MHSTKSAALSPMTGGPLMFLSIVLLVNSFYFRLAGMKKKTLVVKYSSVLEKRLCHEKSHFVKIND